MIRTSGWIVAISALTVVFLGTVSEAKVPRKLRGKAFVSATPVVDSDKKLMVDRFSKQRKAHLLLKRNKTKVWKATVVAFPKRVPYPGPITIWWYDTADKEAIKARHPTHAESVYTKASSVFVHDIVMDPDDGFNSGRTYRIYIGQIIGKRSRYYAKGTLTLAPPSTPATEN